MRRDLAALACLAAIACGRTDEPPRQQAAAAEPAVATTSPRNCLRLELAPLTVARVDEPQRRLFVAAPGATEAQLQARVRDLDACFGFTEWAGRWSLSVFTDAALARYKDDPHVADAVRDGRWARAYVAEYDAATKQTTRNPAAPK